MRESSLFALGAGGYVAGTVGTALVLTASTPSSLAVVAGVAVGISLAVTAAATRLSTPSRVERFQSSRVQVSVVVGLVVLTAAVVTAHHGLLGLDRDVFWPGGIGLGVAFLGAVTVLHAGERRYAARVEAESDVHVVLPDPSANGPGTRWQLAALALGAVALALALLGDGLDTTWLFATLAGLIPFLTAQRRSELVVLDAGLKQGVSVRPWDDFETYEMTDDELVIRDDGWFPREYVLPRADIENEDAVVAALSQYLAKS